MRRYTMPSIEPALQLAPRDLERLVDVNPQEALPHRDVSTVAPHKPGVTGIRLTETVIETDLAHMAHLYNVRTRPHLYFENDVETTTDAWRQIARAQGRLLYDCASCKITWRLLADDNACPVGHPILED